MLTGSGISAESGVATFRDADGIWAQYDYREVATPEAFAANPALVHRFYNHRRRGLGEIEPNAAHDALARLESDLLARGGELTLITQNVDNLHERAGSRNLLHIHGELNKGICQHCDHVFEAVGDLSEDDRCVACDNDGGLRPYVVWFGEMPRFLDSAASALVAADLFVSIGTSGSVYPAAGFVAQAREYGVETMELNLEPSQNAALFDTARYGPATEIVTTWAREIVASLDAG